MDSKDVNNILKHFKSPVYKIIVLVIFFFWLFIKSSSIGPVNFGGQQAVQDSFNKDSHNVYSFFQENKFIQYLNKAKETTPKKEFAIPLKKPEVVKQSRALSLEPAIFPSSNNSVNDASNLITFFDSLSSAIDRQDWAVVITAYHAKFMGPSSISGRLNREQELDLLKAKAVADYRLTYKSIEKIADDGSMVVIVLEHQRDIVRPQKFRLIKKGKSWLLMERLKE